MDDAADDGQQQHVHGVQVDDLPNRDASVVESEMRKYAAGLS